MVSSLEPQVFQGIMAFLESYNCQKFPDVTGNLFNFVPDNHSHSKQNVLRGLHYQI